MVYENIIRVEKLPIYTDAVLAEFKKTYGGLEVNESTNGNGLDFIVEKLTKTQIKEIQTDLQFYQKNPELPVENLCNHLWNYRSKNESQEQLLSFARALIEFKDPSRAAGLFIHGESGVGKTHISVAVTKELMESGQEAYFHSTGGSIDERDGVIELKGRNSIKLGANQVWVIDDLNSPFGVDMGVFKSIVLNSHNKGGRVFVTSNTDYDKLMLDAFVGDHEEEPRYMDRTKGMFKVLHVLGESNRQEKTWYSQVGSSEIDRLEERLNDAIKNEDYEEAARIRDEIKGKSGKKTK